LARGAAGTVIPPSEDWLVALPKAEVHVHLEGCIAPTLLDDAAGAAGVDPPEVAAIRTLDDLLAVLDRSCALFTEAAQLEWLAYEFSRREHAEGVLYADVIANPAHWPSWQGRLDEFVEALDRGFAAAEADGLTPVGLCVSIKRDESRAAAVELVQRLVEARHPRVVALSIDGNEAAAGRTGPRFAEAFELAARHGLRRCAHAGESSGPDGVRDAIEILGAERIEHGIRSVEDPALVTELARRQIPLGICPTSNVRLGTVPSLREHPVGRLMAAGVRVSINTDDPVLLTTNLTTELAITADVFGIGRGSLGALARTSIDASFASPEMKRDLHRDLDRYLGGASVTPPGPSDTGA
jgi:adenosine deaminase